MQPKTKIIISGGGTGGHIYPALAIADEVKRMEPDAEFLFVGAEGKMEMEKVPAAGYQIIGLPIAGLKRSLSLKNLSFPFKLLSSLTMARRIIREFKPNVAVGVGGYASGPVLFSASNRGIPSLIQEQNSFAGITNRLLAKKVNKICVAFEGMEKFFPKEKIIITGNPVRKEMVDLKGKKQDALDFFKLDPNKKTLLVVGGSLGSWSINEAIQANLQKWEDSGFQLIWQTGKLYYEKAKEAAEKLKWVHVHQFINRMDFAYASADLIVSRAGASAVSEISIIRKPSILIPLPSAAEDHQTKNALTLVNSNAAILIKDKDAKKHLGEKVDQLIFDEKALKSFSENIKNLNYGDSAKRIAEEVLKLARGK